MCGFNYAIITGEGSSESPQQGPDRWFSVKPLETVVVLSAPFVCVDAVNLSVDLDFLNRQALRQGMLGNTITQEQQ